MCIRINFDALTKLHGNRFALAFSASALKHPACSILFSFQTPVAKDMEWLPAFAHYLRHNDMPVLEACDKVCCSLLTSLLVSNHVLVGLANSAHV